MIVFLASWAMMFAALFFVYGFARSKSLSWPPPGAPSLPVALPALNTAVLLASSATFARGLRELRRGHRSAFTAMVSVTFGLGAVFLGLQLLVFRQVAASGLSLGDGIYGAVFYAFTAFHGLHVAVGLAILLWVLFRSRGAAHGTDRGSLPFSEHNTIAVRVCTMYWHFVDAVWVLMFFTIYVL
ncbi:MAG: heme-copper oxidase subunit III [Byssovorax sp.]